MVVTNGECKFASPALNLSPIFAAFSAIFSDFNTSKDFMATAHAKGFPP